MSIFNIVEFITQREIQAYVNTFYDAHDEVYKQFNEKLIIEKTFDLDLAEACSDLKLVIQKFESFKKPIYFT